MTTTEPVLALSGVSKSFGAVAALTDIDLQVAAGSILVNCARGALLDYAAAADALRSGRLYAAAFDVFDIEPLPVDHPLRSAPNVVLTPHLGGASQQVARRASRMAAAEVARWAQGLPPLHPAA